MEELKDQSRREFLKKISIISGSALVLTSMPWINSYVKGNNAGKSASDKVRLGIIGVGDRGSLLLLTIKQFEKEGNVEIAAVCDNYQPNYENALKLAGGNVKGFYDYRKLLELNDIDAVVIATPLHEHAHIAVDAMRAGKHVFCEKSMARTIEDAKLMNDTHTNTNRILQIGHQRLFDPVYLEAIDRIKKGEIGKITQMRMFWHRNNNWRRPVPKEHPELERKINWRLYKEYSAGLMTELASHQLQVGNWIMGEAPVSVMGAGSINYWKDGREVYDNVELIYSYSNGTQLIYDSVISNKHYGCEEQILGDKGTMELEINKVYSEHPPKAPGIQQLITDIEKGIFDTIPIGGATWIPEVGVRDKGEFISGKYKMDEVQLQLEAFVKYVRDGKAPEELTVEGYRGTIWSLLGEKAIMEGNKIEYKL
jgi:predicted dehydrogenase